MKRVPIITLAIAAISAAVALIPGAAELMQFDRAAVASGQLWRLFTGHLAHFGTQHFLYDTIVFVGLGVVSERHRRRSFVGCVLTAAILISAAVAWFQPALATYRGLSGIDSALFGLLAVRILRDAQLPNPHSRLLFTLTLLATLGFFAKTAFELLTSSTFFVSSSGLFLAVPLAHLVGAASGAAIPTPRPSPV